MFKIYKYDVVWRYRYESIIILQQHFYLLKFYCPHPFFNVGCLLIFSLIFSFSPLDVNFQFLTTHFFCRVTLKRKTKHRLIKNSDDFLKLLHC